MKHIVLPELRHRFSRFRLGNVILLLPALASCYFLFDGLYTKNLLPKNVELSLLLLIFATTPFLAIPKIRKTKTALIVFACSSLCLMPFVICNYLIGKTDPATILFHLEFGLAGFDFSSVIRELIFATSLVLALNISMRNFCLRSEYGTYVAGLTALVFFAVNPVFIQYIKPLGTSLGIFKKIEPFDLTDYYTQPTQISGAARPKNLIIIYLEGLERTYADESRFGDAFDSLSDLSYPKLDFTNIAQARYTEWSIAGMVASQCGIPLIRHGVFLRNRFDTLSDFLPNSTCLGDILEELGYQNEFIVGASARFAGIDTFYLRHGYDNITELADLAPRANGDLHKWGVHDNIVFDFAKERVLALDQSGQPYSLIVETIGPHGPKGHLAPECRQSPEQSDTLNILESVDCTASLAAEFVDFAFDNIDMSNTSILLLSDHLAHKNNVTKLLNQTERFNTMFVLGGGINDQTIAKPGTMIDIFPTILALLDISINSDRAGLGVSLLSETPTLTEQYTLPSLNQTLFEDNILSGTLWENTK